MKIIVITTNTNDVGVFLNGSKLVTLESDQVGTSPVELAENLARIMGFGIEHVPVTLKDTACWTWEEVLEGLSEPLSPGDVDLQHKLRLTVECSYTLNGMEPSSLKTNLIDLINHGYQNGLITGNSEAEINSMSVVVESMCDEPRALEEVYPADAPNDYRMVDSANRLWIQVQNVAVHIKQNPDSVTVELGPYGIPLSLMKANQVTTSFEDVEKMLFDEVGIDIVDLVAWSGEGLAKIENMSYRERAKLIAEYTNAHPAGSIAW